MQILLVGGTGVLSTAVTTEALNNKIGVTMINRGNRPIPFGVEHIRAEKKDYVTIARAISGRKFDAVIDFLCTADEDTEASVKFYINYTNQYFYISSCAVYDTRVMNGKYCEEDCPKVLPMWSYSVGKWNSEQKIKKLFEKLKSNYTIIRPCVTKEICCYGNDYINYYQKDDI